MFSHAAYKSYPAAPARPEALRPADGVAGQAHEARPVAGRPVGVHRHRLVDRGLDEQTPLEVITSSGTTGTLSIIPKDRPGPRSTCATGGHVLPDLRHGAPPEDLDPKVDVIWPNFASGKLGHLRMASCFRR